MSLLQYFEECSGSDPLTSNLLLVLCKLQQEDEDQHIPESTTEENSPSPIKIASLNSPGDNLLVGESELLHWL